MLYLPSNIIIFPQRVSLRKSLKFIREYHISTLTHVKFHSDLLVLLVSIMARSPSQLSQDVT